MTQGSQNNTVDLLQHGQEEQHIKAGEYVKSAVYGGLDGLITTLNIALSGIGSSAGAGVIVVLGLASLIGDGVSMGVADYLATKSDDQYMKAEQQRQRSELQNDFEGQKQQMIHIYESMGIKDKQAKEIVDILSENKQGFLKVMMIQQLHLIAGEQSPFRNSVVTFFSFCIFGLMPLIPFIVAKTNNIKLDQNFTYSAIVISLIFLFVLGFAKSFVTSAKWYYSALQTIFIGTISAGASYGIGILFS